MIELIIIPICCAIVAWVVANILTSKGMILAPIHNLIIKLPEFIHKPLITCPYCMAGQYVLWIYLYLQLSFNEYNLLHHIWAVAFSIFVVEIINRKLS